MQPLISLIIPVYNVEKYLEKCMDSVLAQTYKNFEVILVDDGSTDGSGRICEEYAKRDSRLRVFHKPNGGLSDARNFGVEKAKGDLVAFVDSDDYVSEDYLEYLYYLMRKYDADISGNKRESLRDNEKPRQKIGSETEYCLTTEEAMEEICYATVIGVSACVKLFKREILVKVPYPVGKIYEDIATTYKQIAECKKIAMGTRVTYYYVQRMGSIRHSPLDEQKFYGLVAADDQFHYIQLNYPHAEQAAHVRCAAVAADYVPMIFDTHYRSKEYFKRIQKYIRPHMRFVLKDKVKSIGFKLRCITVMLGYWPARILWKPGEWMRKMMYGNHELRVAMDVNKSRGGGIRNLLYNHCNVGIVASYIGGVYV